MTFILGIDPGKRGALAFIHEAGCDTFAMPTIRAGAGGKDILDEDALARLIDERNGDGRIAHAFIEQVSAMPGQGVTSMFSFGASFGLIRGIIAAHFIPRTYVRPQAWKRALGVPAAKDGARARASQLMPTSAEQWSRVKDDGRAEAALIALYGAQQQKQVAA